MIYRVQIRKVNQLKGTVMYEKQLSKTIEKFIFIMYQ